MGDRSLSWLNFNPHPLCFSDCYNFSRLEIDPSHNSCFLNSNRAFYMAYQLSLAFSKY